ncbi:MAG: zinc-binding dehydrogenase [Solirubrobacterales bacterium]|nr:zinc-binding dehydrogenase [Solirubrobacterales bacterium]
MRSVVITRHGPPEVLEVQERPDPRPGYGEVLIDVRASGINFADLMARLGFYPDAPKPPCVVGYEVSGTVAALGEGTGDRFSVGDRIAAPVRFGGYAERVVAAASSAFVLPEQLSFEQGAAIPVNYATAWEGIVRAGNVQPGERVLIHSAGGGVGIAATQLAKRAGAEVWGTASPAKHDAIRGFGVDHPVDYTSRGWERGLPKIDLVMDAVGGASFRRSYKLLRAGGRLVCFGASAVVSGSDRNVLAAARTAVQMPWFSVFRQMSSSRSVIGLNALTLWDEHGADRWVGPLTELIADGTIRPVVAEVFTFDRAPDAHRFISERRNVGKVLLTP